MGSGSRTVFKICRVVMTRQEDETRGCNLDDCPDTLLTTVSRGTQWGHVQGTVLYSIAMML